MIRSILLGMLLLCPTFASAATPALPKLKVSENKRFLVKEDGKPFFYLGDTAWELTHRLNREEIDHYLQNRAERGFTVIQTVVLAELNGLRDPNPYGHKPLDDNDPTKPNEDYFKHVDYMVNKANALGMYVGLLPSWGDKWNKTVGMGPEIFTPENAAIYGEFIGKRYKDKGIIWILGGDRHVETDAHKEIIRAMANGLRKGDGGAHLMTFHPPGGNSSADPFHDDPWLDFNMRQNGHVAEYGSRYDLTRQDYARTPTKPVIDGEPIYEDIPVSFTSKSYGHSIAADVRRPLYWDLFAGAFGHAYGHNSVWQMWKPDKPPVAEALMYWDEGINQPGGAQMQYGRWLMESRPFLTRVPDNSFIVAAQFPTSVPGTWRYRFVSTRDEAGSYAMVYAPIGRTFGVKMDVIKGAKVKAWWYNPRDGKATAIGEFEANGERRFSPPDTGEVLDWVLVLDDAAKNYPPPGTRQVK